MLFVNSVILTPLVLLGRLKEKRFLPSCNHCGSFTVVAECRRQESALIIRAAFLDNRPLAIAHQYLV